MLPAAVPTTTAQRSLTCDDCPLRAACPRYRRGHVACIVGRNPATSLWSLLVGVTATMTLVLGALL